MQLMVCEDRCQLCLETGDCSVFIVQPTFASLDNSNHQLRSAQHVSPSSQYLLVSPVALRLFKEALTTHNDRKESWILLVSVANRVENQYSNQYWLRFGSVG